MTWVKLDDGFFRNRKARLAGRDGRALFIAGLCHCSNALTDGHVGTYDLPIIAAEAEVKASVAATLVKVGLWEKVDEGWRIHDFERYNRPAAAVRQERDEGRRRAAESAARRREASREASGEERPKKPPGFGTSSTDQSSSSSSPLGVTSVGSSSSTNGAAVDDDDWSTIIAKRRLQRREADKGKVTRLRGWMKTTVADIDDEHREEAARYLQKFPDASALEVADHLEPEPGHHAERPPCVGCSNSGWVETDGNARPCPDCHPKEAAG